MRGLPGIGEQDYDSDLDEMDHDDDAVMDAPHSFGADERRMHVRAYNYWAKLLGERQFPSIEDLDPENIEDFGPNSVLLDFTAGFENPAMTFVGEALRTECALEPDVAHLDDVPGRSLLSRLTDHFMQIVANKAPIGFEAEFVNQRGVTIMYRGILLPFSSNDTDIDFIYGVINWKEMADQATTDALIQDIDRSVAAQPRKASIPVWDDDPNDDMAPGNMGNPSKPKAPLSPSGMEMDNIAGDDDILNLDPMSIIDPISDYGTASFDLSATPPTRDAHLADWLAHARDCAERSKKAQDRSREALYAAISFAYDFAYLSRNAPDDLAEMLEDAGLKAQARAPMTPIIKLVFGADYDKTRITEYATILAFALREQIALGGLAARLRAAKGGLKAIVQEERALRRNTKPVAVKSSRLEQARNALRARKSEPLAQFDAGDDEFAVLVAKRDGDGKWGVVGSIGCDDHLGQKVLHKAAATA